MDGLTFCHSERYGEGGFSVRVGGDALVDISILQGQVPDLKVVSHDIIRSPETPSPAVRILQQKEAVPRWKCPVNI